MISITAATVADIKEAIEISRKNVYCSEELSLTNIMGHPWVISLKDIDGKLGAILGIDLIRPGVGEGWAVTTDNLLIHPIAYTKKVIGIIDEVFSHFELHRLQISVKCESSLVRWAQTLGFIEEGRMIAYGKDKSDYFIMGRVI